MGNYKGWFTFKGRISRKTFIIRALISYAIALFCALMYEPIGSHNINNINWGFYIFLAIILWPSLWVFYASANRRFHDIGKGSLWTTILFVTAPTFIIWFGLLLYLVFKKGTDGDNEYGPDPLQGEKFQEVQVANNTALENETKTITDNDARNNDISMEENETIALASVDVGADGSASVNVDTDLANNETNKDVPIYKTEDETVSQSSNQKPQSITLDDLPKLKKWLDEGIITQEEFNAVKKKVLG